MRVGFCEPEVVDQGAVVGLSVAVLRRGEPIRIQGYGSADLEGAAPVTHTPAPALLRYALP
jgi:hypothetical protein